MLVTGLQNENTDETFYYIQTYKYISSEERDDSEWVFFRGFYSSEREAKKSRQNLQKSKKEMDRIMREMRAKIDTIQVNITRINEEIIEKQSLADKFAKYEERTEQPNEKKPFSNTKRSGTPRD